MNAGTIHQLQAWCFATGSTATIHPDATISTSTGEGVPIARTPEVLRGFIAGFENFPGASLFADHWTPRDQVAAVPGDAIVSGELSGAVVLHAEGYDSLADVLARAFDQAARGKGSERHQVGGEAFADQVILQGARRFGTGALLFQAFKKCEESQRLAYPAAVRELLGAIVYTAAAVIALDEKAQDVANDPQALPLQAVA